MYIISPSCLLCLLCLLCVYSVSTVCLLCLLCVYCVYCVSTVCLLCVYSVSIVCLLCFYSVSIVCLLCVYSVSTVQQVTIKLTCLAAPARDTCRGDPPLDSVLSSASFCVLMIPSLRVGWLLRNINKQPGVRTVLQNCSSAKKMRV